MPELPEVEVVRRGLAEVVPGARIGAVEVLDERALKRHGLGAADFADRLEGRVLGPPSRRGKFLWLPFVDASDEVLFAHLGMSGQLLVRPLGAADERQLRVRIRLDAPAGEWELRFSDQRLFGSLALDGRVPAPDCASERIPAMARAIARDPLDPRFDERAVLGRMRASNRGIKSVLLDQGVVSGVGNIYADEALWRARLHWAQPAATVSTRKARELIGHVRGVFLQALAEGGTSFDALYVNVNGESGYFSRSLAAYGRDGEPCLRCGTALVREAFQNRSSFRCPRCQGLR